MTSWLDSVRLVLETASEPLEVFVRDDDVGWAGERLWRLLDLFDAHEIAADLAVIPAALTPGLARELAARLEAAPGRLGLHQHGFAHVNHEPNGRKCEFGPGRGRASQRRDLAAGAARLAAFLGESVDPIFTPPWNRCVPVTGECLVELGFAALSRESRAEPLGVPGLVELPVSADWFARRGGVRLTRERLGTLVAAALAAPGPTGLIFHHSLMDAAEREEAGRLLSLLASHPSVRLRTMRALVEQARAR